MRVLVVEDEQDLGEVFRDFLAELGHQPVVVRTAEAALGKLATERPDAIILDIHLPGMSGIDFLQLRPIRESGLPIVAVSGVVTESQARECLRLGALDFVGKPVPLQRLSDVLTFLEPHALNRQRDEGAKRAERRRGGTRAHARFPVRVIEYSGRTSNGTCVELAPLGVKVRVDVPPTTGTAVKLTFTLPEGGEPIEVMALVVRVDRDGVVFTLVNPGESNRQRLAAAVHRLQRT
ncbi:MAG: response regulator [Candidatus Rokuibacteriota bacterium]